MYSYLKKSKAFCLNLIDRFELVILNSFLTIVSLGQTIIITKFLSQEDYGIYGFYLTLSHFIYVFGNWGYVTWGTHAIASDVPNKTKIYLSIMSSRILTCSSAFLVLIAYIFLVLNIGNITVFIAFFIYSTSLMLSPEILFIADNRIKNMVIINLCVKGIYIIFLLGFLLSFDLSPNVIFLLFSILMISSSLMLLYFTSLKISIKNLISKITIKPISESYPNFLITIFSFIFASAPLILAGSYMEKEYFSVLYASFTIIKMLQTVYHPMIQRIIPRLNRLSVQRSKVFYAIKNDLVSALIFSITCCIIIWFTAPVIVNVIFSSKYLGLRDALVLFSIALIPGLLSTILVTQVAIYLDIIRQAYTAIGLSCVIIFLILFINISNLDAYIVIKSMILGEWILFLTMIILVYIRAFSKPCISND